MVRRIAVACVAFCLGLVALCHSSSRAQDQPEAERKVLNKVTPGYPDTARRLQLSGTVKVEVVVRALRNNHRRAAGTITEKAAFSKMRKGLFIITG